MYFEFNFYSVLLIPAVIQGLLFTCLLWIRGWGQILSDRILALLLLLNTIKVAFWMLGFAGWYDIHDWHTSFMFYFPFNNFPWIGPLLYFYFLSLTNNEFHWNKKYFKHLIVPIAWSAFIIVKFLLDIFFYYPFANSESTQYGCRGPLAELDKSPVALCVGFISFFYYAYITLKAFDAYKLYIRNNFSETSEIEFNWLRNLIYISIFGCVVFLLFVSLSTFTTITYKIDWIAYFTLGIIIYYLSIAGYTAPKHDLKKLHFDFNEVKLPIIAEKTEKIISDEIIEWKLKLESWMAEKQPYLAPELTLIDLAKQLDTSLSVLSKVINDGMGRNFNDFINSYRVNAVIDAMRKGTHLKQTLLGLAYDCGFNSKATFNRSFKKNTGMAPREFLLTLNEEIKNNMEKDSVNL